MKQTTSAGGVLLNSEGEVYLIHKLDRDEWLLPKGGVEDGEDVAETALREVQEETGYQDIELVSTDPISTEHYQFKHPTTGEEFDKTVYYFKMALRSEDQTATPEMRAEGLEGEWFGLEEAVEKISYFDLKKILRNVQKSSLEVQ